VIFTIRIEMRIVLKMKVRRHTSTLAVRDFRFERRKITLSPKEEQPAKLGSSESFAVGLLSTALSLSLSLSLSVSLSVPRVSISPLGAGTTSRENTTKHGTGQDRTS
jgi:hypothetical protein